MKIRVTMKTPDVLYDAIDEAITTIEASGLSEEEIEDVREERRKAISEICSLWFKYGEYLNVEIDTEAMTCTVLQPAY